MEPDNGTKVGKGDVIKSSMIVNFIIVIFNIILLSIANVLIADVFLGRWYMDQLAYCLGISLIIFGIVYPIISRIVQLYFDNRHILMAFYLSWMEYCLLLIFMGNSSPANKYMSKTAYLNKPSWNNLSFLVEGETHNFITLIWPLLCSIFTILLINRLLLKESNHEELEEE
jgi:hypothetical protein